MIAKENKLSEHVARAIRHHRQRLGFSLRSLAAESGISASMLSDLERAIKSPTLDTLAAVAGAFGLPVTALLEGRPPVRRLHVRRATKAAVNRRAQVRRQDLISTFGVSRIKFTRYVLPAGRLAGPFDAHPAGTLEHVHLEAGRLRFVLGIESVVLAAGDSCSCFADATHLFDNTESKAEARFYVVAEPT